MNDSTQAAYEAFEEWLAKSSPGGLSSGVPKWEDLIPRYREAWDAALVAAKMHEARTIIDNPPSWWVNGPEKERTRP